MPVHTASPLSDPRIVLISDAYPAAPTIDKIDDPLEIKLRRSLEEKKENPASRRSECEVACV